MFNSFFFQAPLGRHVCNNVSSPKLKSRRDDMFFGSKFIFWFPDLTTFQKLSNLYTKPNYKVPWWRYVCSNKTTLHTSYTDLLPHLLENGTDIRYIQSFLGYSSIKTTMIYTHLGKTAVDKIQSPLDRLVQNEKIRKLNNVMFFWLFS